MSVRQENRLASVYATVWKDDNATLTTAMILASAIRAALFRHLAMGRAVVRARLLPERPPQVNPAAGACEAIWTARSCSTA